MSARFVVRQHYRPWGRRYTFQLLAANGEPITGPSEPYSSLQAALDGIEAVQREAAGATVDLSSQPEK